MSAPKRRYRKWSVRAWDDDRFRALTPPPPNAQTLYMFLVLGPHTTAFPAAFRSTRAGIAEDLGWDTEAFAEGFTEAFEELIEKGMVQCDFKTKLVYVPGALKHNAPESPNVCIAWAKAMRDLPDSPLQDAILEEVVTFLRETGKAFLEAFTKAFGKSSRRLTERSFEGYAESGTGTGAGTGAGTGSQPGLKRPPGDRVKPAKSDPAGSEGGEDAGSRISVLGPPPEGCGECEPFGYNNSAGKVCTCELGGWRMQHFKLTGEWPRAPRRAAAGQAAEAVAPEDQADWDKIQAVLHGDVQAEEPDEELPV